MADLAKQFNLAPESDASEFLSVNKRTLANQRSQGIGPPFVRMGKKIYYPLDGLREFITKNTVTPSSAPTLIHSPKARQRRRKK